MSIYLVMYRCKDSVVFLQTWMSLGYSGSINSVVLLAKMLGILVTCRLLLLQSYDCVFDYSVNQCDCFPTGTRSFE